MIDGLADGVVQDWFGKRTFGPSTFSTGDLLQAKKDKGVRISVCLPALNEEATVGPICSTISAELMSGVGLVDELVVIDSNSTDGTADAARAAGARVYAVNRLVPQVPLEPGGGKGDALWRSLSVATGDIIVWLDSDTRNFSPKFVTELVGPLLVNDGISFVKAFYERPLVTEHTIEDQEGGRVTEILVRPLLAAFVPQLSGVIQPLSGEYACRREVAIQIPFATGYAVDVCLLIDILESRGLSALAQADLGMRVHRNRDLAALGRTSFEILHGFFTRLEEHGRIKLSEMGDVLTQSEGEGSGMKTLGTKVDVVTRPPMDSLTG